MRKQYKTKFWVWRNDDGEILINGQDVNSEWAHAYQLVLQDVLMEKDWAISMMQKKLIMAKEEYAELESLLKEIGKARR